MLCTTNTGRDEAGWIVEERWDELRKLGQAGGWLVKHHEVIPLPALQLLDLASACGALG